jgi:hypothetical protein
MKKSIISKMAGALLALLLVPQAKAAVVGIVFDQLSNVFIDSSLTQSLANGSYFAFGSFSSDSVAAGITQSNILTNLRSTSTWFKSFETSFVNSDDYTYDILNATASTSTGTSPRQFAYAIYINDTVANVQAALAQTGLGAATGITREFGVFTYSNNSNPALRAALPRDPTDYPADGDSFATTTPSGAGLNRFIAVPGLGNVAAGGISLIPEPSSVSLLLLGLGCVAVARRKSV